MKWEGWLRKEGAPSELLTKGTEQIADLDPEIKKKVIDLMKSIIAQVEKRTALGVTFEEEHAKG